MVTNTVRLDWVQENRYLLWDRDGFPIVMSPSPNGVNGADLLPLSLIGCSAWDIMDILKEQGVTVAGLDVSAECQQDDDPPWRFQRILVHYRFRGQNLDIGTLRQAIRLSEEKYCSIYNTLSSAVDISMDVEIIDSQPGR